MQRGGGKVDQTQFRPSQIFHGSSKARALVSFSCLRSLYFGHRNSWESRTNVGDRHQFKYVGGIELSSNLIPSSFPVDIGSRTPRRRETSRSEEQDTSSIDKEC